MVKTQEEKDNDTRQYLANGGHVFFIKTIDGLRDGGTKVIFTSKETYYLDKDKCSLHYNYPTCDENLIKNPLLKIYIIDRIEKYKKDLQQNIILCQRILSKLKD